MAQKPFVLLMRRDLDGAIEPARWPAGVKWRSLHPSDAKAAHDVLASGYWEGASGAPEFRKWWDQLRRDDEFDAALCFLAIDGQGVAGVAQCWTSAFVKDLAVLPRARRTGVARALMLTVFDAFAQRGASSVSLKVREENTSARSLYDSLGMSVVARQRG